MKNLITRPRGIASLLATVALALGVQDVSYGQPPVEGNKIYWTEAKDLGWIQRADLDGSNLESLLTTELEINPKRITLAQVAGKIYWTEVDAEWEGTIRRANFDGSEVEILITGLQDPFDLTLDIFAHKMYWTDLLGRTIHRADLEGTNVETLVTGLEAPANIALGLWFGDPCTTCATKIQAVSPSPDRRPTAKIASPSPTFDAPTKMFWTDRRAGTIQRADLNGKNVETLITGLGSPVDIVIDEDGYVMYWAERDTGTIKWADLDGKNVETLVTGVENVVAISLGGGVLMLWMEWNSDSAAGTIRGSTRTDRNKSASYTIASYTTTDTKGPGDLESANGGGLYWTDTNRIYRTDNYWWRRENYKSEPIAMGVQGPTSIAVDVTGDKMYWVDKRTDAIHRSNLDGTNVEDLLTEVAIPKDIALDLVAGTMYWTEQGTGVIRRADLDGSNAEILVEVENPQSIALDVARGKMYWTAREASPFSDAGIIQRADLDGENVATLLTGLHKPENIALDLVAGAMYWTDGEILRANLDGSNLEIIIPRLARPVDLALDAVEGKLYWTNKNGGSIQRADLDGENVKEIVSGLVRPVGIALDVPLPVATLDAADITLTTNLDPCSNGLAVPNPLQNQGLVEDCRALLAFRNTRNPGSNLNWSAASPITRWKGVYIEDSRVTGISFYPRDYPFIGGPIPPELGQLTELRDLDLTWSSGLTGAIPPELGQLTNLVGLYLSGNALTGAIPPELGQLTNLERLYLDSNALTGAIPPELGNLIKLTKLDLSANELIEPIPPELGQLTNLTDASPSYNEVTGFNLAHNKLTGPIPPELSQLTQIEKLYLRGNKLTGPIPPELDRFTELDLSDNELTAIPSGLEQLTNLERLNLGNNSLTGPIPPELSQMTQLKFLNLSNNELTGSIPPELGDLTNLVRLDLSNNELTGSIPPELGNLTQLKDLLLYSNKLTGTIPVELVQLTRLEWMGIHQDNQLTGCVPAPLAHWVKGWPLCSGFAIFVPDCCWRHVPGIGGASRRRVLENTLPGESLGPVQTQSAADAILTFSLAGSDSASFAIDAAGEITVGDSTTLDFEIKKSYSIVVYLSDGIDHQGLADPSVDDTLRVIIELINVEEAGTVTLSSTHPVVGDPLTASLSDPDGLVSHNPPRWQWQQSEDLPTPVWGNIPRARSDVYSPTIEDEGRLLRATVTYGDGHGYNKSAESDPTAAVATPRSTANSVVAADFDGDGTTDFADFFLFTEHFGSSATRFDLNASGVVDFADFFLFAEHFAPPAQAKLVAMAQELIGLPNSSQLQQNAPNPFNSQTILSYFLHAPSPARLEVFSLTGQRVAVLHRGPQQAGYHRLHWNGRDDAGRPVASGMYLYRLVTDEAVLTRKLMLLR